MAIVRNVRWRAGEGSAKKKYKLYNFSKALEFLFLLIKGTLPA
jgi:hypothetical protein